MTTEDRTYAYIMVNDQENSVLIAKKRWMDWTYKPCCILMTTSTIALALICTYAFIHWAPFTLEDVKVAFKSRLDSTRAIFEKEPVTEIVTARMDSTSTVAATTPTPTTPAALPLDPPDFCPTNYTWFEQTGYCYKTSTSKKSFRDAEQSCQLDQAHLASIHSEIENIFIVGLYHDVDMERKPFFWIGLNITSWTDGSPVDFQNWKRQDKRIAHFATISDKGILWMMETSRSKNYGFICKRQSLLGPKMTAPSTNATCKLGYTWLKSTKSCYKISIASSTFAEAEEACKKENANLLSVHSKLELSFLNGLVKKTLETHSLRGNEEVSRLWIGLMANEWTYSWTDGSQLDVVHYTLPSYLKKGNMVRWDDWLGWRLAKPSQRSGYICKMGEEHF